MLDPKEVARALGGEAFGRNVLAPGPRHGPSDGSLSIKIDPTAPDGFIVNSFALNPFTECRDHVREALRIVPEQRPHHPSQMRRSPPAKILFEDGGKSQIALKLWRESQHPRGTLVEKYLASRGLSLSNEVAGEVIRFHPALSFGDGRVAGMVALYRHIRTDEPRALHRTFLDGSARKLNRRSLGPMRDAAIKLSSDENVTAGLHLSEGIETGLAAQLIGFQPVWALGSATMIDGFPVLGGIETISVLGENGDGGANARAAQVCADRWLEAGREAFFVAPLSGNDMNDVLHEFDVNELPPPDPRLSGKVKVIKLAAGQDVLGTLSLVARDRTSAI